MQTLLSAICKGGNNYRMETCSNSRTVMSRLSTHRAGDTVELLSSDTPHLLIVTCDQPAVVRLKLKSRGLPYRGRNAAACMQSRSF